VADLEAVRTAVERVLAGLGLDVVDVELVGSGRARVLRVSAERADGTAVDLETLASASEPVSEALDAVDAVPGPYTLEVSSPGVERPLRRPGDFRRFVGTTVSVKSHEAVAGERRHRGRLLEADDDGIVLEVDGQSRPFLYEAIAQARTVFEWGPAPKPGRPGKKRAGRRAPGGSQAGAAVGSEEMS
jgi:ribosome maturation factor RimP